MLFILIQALYNLIDAVAYFASAAVPLYFIIKSKKSTDNPMRVTMVILAGFVIAQGVYHTASVFGLNLLSKAVLEPLSAAVLAAAALSYLLMSKGLQKQKVRSHVTK
jgi:hypothetical protein